ncbi:hypothetical protein COW46_02020 [Candidatus Gracilibacteria bacterium CG17_big_fil_post_rev_8_21_14_2_50_48_13]|nr:MAG: hypothetical protein COW46_02020 [Candidatus Gracilibacteria bacterium CG17_big_fil_post_rev_8_21_14_2_50_48_13]
MAANINPVNEFQNQPLPQNQEGEVLKSGRQAAEQQLYSNISTQEEFFSAAKLVLEQPAPSSADKLRQFEEFMGQIPKKFLESMKSETVQAFTKLVLEIMKPSTLDKEATQTINFLQNPELSKDSALPAPVQEQIVQKVGKLKKTIQKGLSQINEDSQLVTRIMENPAQAFKSWIPSPENTLNGLTVQSKQKDLRTFFSTIVRQALITGEESSKLRQTLRIAPREVENMYLNVDNEEAEKLLREFHKLATLTKDTLPALNA